MQILNLTPAAKTQHCGDFRGDFHEESCVPADAIFLLGYFDGVHIGHQALIDEAHTLASCESAAGHPIVIWTFEHMPKASADSGLLTTKQEKCLVLSSLGADYIIFEDFDALRSLDGESFFIRHIASHSPYAVICGYDYRFGRMASCGPDDLAKFASDAGIRSKTISSRTLSGEVVSSTLIRTLISEGDMRKAADLLGRRYSFSSEVIHGKELGRTIGRPTINQRFPADKVSPRHGVYSCTASFTSDGRDYTFGGVCNIGYRPTVNNNENDITVETYIIGFSGDLYGKDVKISFAEYLRGETKFSSVSELAEQIAKDEKDAKMSLGL